MKIDAIAETCELENKQSAPVDTNAVMLDNIADKVEQVISAKLEEFNKTVNTADKEQINNSGVDAANNDNAGDSTGNNNGANGGAEQE